MRGHILFETALPLSWTVLSDESPALADSHNHVLFKLLEYLGDPILQNPDAEYANDFVRIEAKLNVIMHLVSQLLQTRQPQPPAVTIRFTSDTLAWRVDNPPPPGTRLHVSLYPDHSIPLSLDFVAKVCGVSNGWLEVDMHGLNEDELAIWSRWVFRQHRRQVAQARLSAEDPHHQK